LPIDYFFRSLAEDRGELAIGIALSGTGSDGTFGVRAIKEAGGTVMVQDVASCACGEMRALIKQLAKVVKKTLTSSSPHPE